MTWPRTYRAWGLAAVALGPARRLPSWSTPPAPGRGRPVTVRLPDLVGAERRVIAERVRRLVVIFAVDDSGSTFGPHGTDPQGVRYVACQAVLDLIRRHGGGRAGVVHWGQAAPAELAVAPVPVRRRRQLKQALRLRPQLGGTNPAVALARARELVGALGPNETLVVVLLTDAQHRGVALEQELAQLPAGAVHLVLVDPSGDCWGQESEWRALPWRSFTRLPTFRDPAQVAWASGTVLARVLGLELPPVC